MCPLIQFGPVTVSGYWLMAVLGVAASVVWLVAENRSGRFEAVPGRHLSNLCFLAILSIFAGGKLMGVLVNLPELIGNWAFYASDPAVFWAALTQGRAFYGGLILLAVVFVGYARWARLSGNTLCALFVPATALFMVFGRMGCFLGGCCYGVPAAHGVVFPENSLAPSGVPLFPSQLVEAAAQLALFAVLVVLERRLRRQWLLVPVYIGCYALIRFVLEFWRGDTARGVWLLSSSQWVSLALMAAVGTFCAVAALRRRRTAS